MGQAAVIHGGQMTDHRQNTIQSKLVEVTVLFVSSCRTSTGPAHGKPDGYTSRIVRHTIGGERG